MMTCEKCNGPWQSYGFGARGFCVKGCDLQATVKADLTTWYTYDKPGLYSVGAKVGVIGCGLLVAKDLDKLKEFAKLRCSYARSGIEFQEIEPLTKPMPAGDESWEYYSYGYQITRILYVMYDKRFP